MRRILFAAAALSLIWLTTAAAQSQKKPPARQTTRTAKKKPTIPARTVASTRGKKTPAKRPSVTWRNRQTVPSQDRYREIQTALASRGYLDPDAATGAWNQTSIDALKRFQTEQNLEGSGKINSLSLIALGLGPKRDSAPVVPPKPQIDGGIQ